MMHGEFDALRNMMRGEYDACQCHVIGSNEWDHSDVFGIWRVDTHVCEHTIFPTHDNVPFIANQSHGTSTSHLGVTPAQPDIYGPLTKLREGNIFICVCLSFCPRGLSCDHYPCCIGFHYTGSPQSQSWSTQTCLYVWETGTPSLSPL